MVLNLDLNSPPVEGTSDPMNPQVAPAESSKGLLGSPIDVEAINDYDDDELKLLPSSTSFPQGRNRARRNHHVTVDLEAPVEIPPAQTGFSIAEPAAILLSLSGQSTTERASTTNRNNINNHQYVDLEEINNCKGMNRARRNHRVTVDLEAPVEIPPAQTGFSIAEPAAILLSLSGQSTTERASTTNRNNVNYQQYVDLEAINNCKMKNGMARAVGAQLPMPSPPPKDPTFACPLCFEPLKNPCSTFCGHIFCQSCIEARMASSTKERKGRLCPTCQSKLPAKKSFHRVYLPNAD